MTNYLDVVMDGGKPWGICLQGGKGSTFPLRIAKVTQGSKASSKGLKTGTLIREINGYDVMDWTMTEAQDLIKATGNTLHLRVFLPSADGKYISMEGGKPWGMRLQGGKGSDLRLMVAQITAGSKAAGAGLLVGDEIISINDNNTEQLTLTEAQNIIKETGETLQLTIRCTPPNSQQTQEKGGSVSLSSAVSTYADEPAFHGDILNPVDGGEENWGVHEAKGNTFNMVRDHVDAGQGYRVLTVFDVPPGERNKSIPTVAPKIQRTRDEEDLTNAADSNSGKGREIIIRGGKPWGIRLSSCGNSITIANVTPGSKAYNAGLLFGDHITLINNTDTEGMTLQGAEGLIKETGEELKLCIKRTPIQRLENGNDEAFFNDLRISMSGGKEERKGGVKGNAFKMLQNVVDSQEQRRGDVMMHHHAHNAYNGSMKQK